MTVTKEYLQLVVTEVVSQLSAKIDTKIAEVRAEIVGVRTELGAEIAGVHTELAAHRAETAASFDQFGKEITELHHVTSVNHYKVVGRIDQVASMLAEHMAAPQGHPEFPERKRA